MYAEAPGFYQSAFSAVVRKKQVLCGNLQGAIAILKGLRQGLCFMLYSASQFAGLTNANATLTRANFRLFQKVINRNLYRSTAFGQSFASKTTCKTRISVAAGICAPS